MRIGRPLLGLAAATLLPVAQPAGAQGTPRELSAELLLGTAWSLPAPLVIHMPGQPVLRLRAHYSTRPLRDAPYYAYRVSAGTRTARGAVAGYDVGEIHHKVYLDNPVPPIEHFEISHGYNLVGPSAVRPAGRFEIRAGLGLVLAHAEGRIAGQPVGGTRRTFLHGGYHIAGLTALLAIGRRYPLGHGATALYAHPEAMLTASIARVPVGDAGGYAVVPDVAIHALTGLGVRRVWH